MQLASDVRKVEIVRCPGRGRLRRRRSGGSRAAVEQPHRVAKRRGGEHPETVDRLGLRVVLDRHDECADALSPAREADGERAAHGLDLAVQRELADHGERADAPVRDRAGGGEDAQRDRQIE